MQKIAEDTGQPSKNEDNAITNDVVTRAIIHGSFW